MFKTNVQVVALWPGFSHRLQRWGRTHGDLHVPPPLKVRQKSEVERVVGKALVAVLFLGKVGVAGADLSVE